MGQILAEFQSAMICRVNYLNSQAWPLKEKSVNLYNDIFFFKNA